MGQRSRKRRAGSVPSAGAPASPASGDAMERGYARGRARDEAIRAQLEPLAPGERPRAVTVAAILALLLALGNVLLYALGYDVRGETPKPGGVIVFAALMLAAAAGMWTKQYWAVLGFQALLGISMIFSALSLLVASNVQGAVLSLFILGGSGALFWFLVKAMARIQMPERRPSGSSSS